MLKKLYWPPINADERGYKDAKAFVFDRRLSAANLIFDLFSSLLDGERGTDEAAPHFASTELHGILTVSERPIYNR